MLFLLYLELRKRRKRKGSSDVHTCGGEKMVWTPRYEDSKYDSHLGTCQKCKRQKVHISKHHINGSGKGPTIDVCQSCHDKIHGIQRKEDVTSLERRIRRAKRRIKRDTKILEETKVQLKEKRK